MLGGSLVRFLEPLWCRRSQAIPPEASGFYSTLLCPRRSERERERESRVPSCWELNSPHGQTAGLVVHTRRSAPLQSASLWMRGELVSAPLKTAHSWAGSVSRDSKQPLQDGPSLPTEPRRLTLFFLGLVPVRSDGSFLENRPLASSRTWCTLVLFFPQDYFTSVFFFILLLSPK